MRKCLPFPWNIVSISWPGQVTEACYPVLPWTVCHEDLQSDLDICIPSGDNKSSYVVCHHPNNITNFNTTLCVKNGTDPEELDQSSTNVSIISSAEQYFTSGVLNLKTDISDGLGLPDPTLAGCLAVCWLLIYLTLRKVKQTFSLLTQ